MLLVYDVASPFCFCVFWWRYVGLRWRVRGKRELCVAFCVCVVGDRWGYRRPGRTPTVPWRFLSSRRGRRQVCSMIAQYRPARMLAPTMWYTSLYASKYCAVDVDT